MDGNLTLMTQAEYQDWLTHGGAQQSNLAAGRGSTNPTAAPAATTAPSRGEGARLVGLYGRPVHLADGRTLTADADYIRAKILNPNENRLAGDGEAGDAELRRACNGEDELSRGDPADIRRLVGYLKPTTASRKEPPDEQRRHPARRRRRARSPHPSPTLDRPDDYLHAESTLRSWFLTTDHKRIALLYLAASPPSSSSARWRPASCASPGRARRRDL